MLFTGKGLHTGLSVEMCVKPAEADFGIVFKRIDLEGSPSVPALAEFVTDTSRGTTIQKGQTRVATIEHIMSALWNMGVDNALIEVNAPETPIMDGSAREYADRIASTGIVGLDQDRLYITIDRPVDFSIADKGVAISVTPADSFNVSVEVDYNSHVLGVQRATFDEHTDYREQVASCRTFVFLHELEPLLNANLIKGGDLDNAIVVVERPISQVEIDRLARIFNRTDVSVTNGYLNNLQLRFDNEIARHKLLDILGDFALLGRRMKGRVRAVHPGHFANTETVKLISSMSRS